MTADQSESSLWTWQELGSALQLSLEEGPSIDGVSIDTRTIDRGDLFVALSGQARPEFNVFEDSGRDGHEFAIIAFESGASAVLVHQSIESDNPVITCAETLEGLWDLARFRRAQLSCLVVAVTGSSGKTTFRQFLQQALELPLTSGSLNNHIGVPLSMARTPKSSLGAVYEIGTNHPGEIEPLSRLVRPNVAVVLNVLNAHIGNFENHDKLLQEKLSIASGLVENGQLIVEESLYEASRTLYPNAAISTFGGTPSATVWYEWQDDERIGIHSPAETYTAKVPGGGEHRAMTLCATAATLHSVGKTMSSLARVSEELPPGRGRVFETAGVTVIDESYNANPDSMRRCLEHLAGFKSRRRIAIVGTMNELGDQSKELHERLVPYLNQLDGVISVGQMMNEFAFQLVEPHKQWREFHSIDGVSAYCREHLAEGDVVLVKGSNTIFWQANFVDHFVGALQNKHDST